MNKRSLIKDLVSWSLKVIIFIVFCYTLIIQNFLVAIAALLALIFSIIPLVIARNMKKLLPLAVDLPVTVALLLHTVGLAFDLYHLEDWWWWDIMTHFLGTVAIATLAFLIVYVLTEFKMIRVSVLIMGIGTFVIALAIGALWEIGEFYFDKIFHTNSLRDVVDTIQDLQFDALGGLVTAGFGMWYVERKKTGVRK